VTNYEINSQFELREGLLEDVPGLVLQICAAPTTNHVKELSKELNYHHCNALKLFNSLFRYTFYCGVKVDPELTVPGVWEVDEVADYKVKLTNKTCFDLSNMRVYLKVINDTGEAEIVGPSSDAIVNLPYNTSEQAQFKVKAKKSGTVYLHISVEGYICAFKKKIYYNGLYCDGSSLWPTYRPEYRQKYTIY